MRLIFAGTPEVAAIALQELATKHEIALVITRHDAPVGRKRVLTPSPVAEVADRLGIETMKTNQLSEEEIARIKGENADLGVVVAFGALLPREALDALEWWNLHFSLLPKWRGATPLQHSIIHGEGQGLTVFRLDEGMDTGDVVGALPMDFGPEQTSAELMPLLANDGAKLILELLKKRPAATAQLGEATFAPKFSRADAKLNFEESAEVNARLIMALNPEPVAWTEAGDESIRILRAKAVGSIDWSSLEEKESAIGSVELSGGKVLVTCGGGTRLQLEMVQPAGKKAMSALDWFRGLQTGIVLG